MESLLHMSHISPMGTQVFVLDEEALLIRVSRGWQYVAGSTRPCREQGLTGLPGRPGLREPTGPEGPQGLKLGSLVQQPKKTTLGSTRPCREQGLTGLPGRPGPREPTGPEGPQGLKLGSLVQQPKKTTLGSTRPCREQGLTGLPGRPGPREPTGPEGPQGLKLGSLVQQPKKTTLGSTRPCREQGLTGLPGRPGPREPTGPEGPQGLKAVTVENMESLLHMSHISPMGTQAFVLDEEALLIRVSRGWQYVALGSVVQLPKKTTTTTSTASPLLPPDSLRLDGSAPKGSTRPCREQGLTGLPGRPGPREPTGPERPQGPKERSTSPRHDHRDAEGHNITNAPWLGSAERLFQKAIQDPNSLTLQEICSVVMAIFKAALKDTQYKQQAASLCVQLLAMNPDVLESSGDREVERRVRKTEQQHKLQQTGRADVYRTILATCHLWFEHRDQMLPRRPPPSASIAGQDAWTSRFHWTAYVSFVASLLEAMYRTAPNSVAPLVSPGYSVHFAYVLYKCCKIMVRSAAHNIATERTCLWYVVIVAVTLLERSSNECKAVMTECIREALRHPVLRAEYRRSLLRFSELQGHPREEPAP
ncbi:uncharacterized protein LOC125944160 [Dermacentor silvarum]|uniref:uncharacterized protein LOC125944160 n=1 Tax=Dermacentor silvarum TaxID=543639 RepID=UPI00210195FE|nr:uncharacterized protein LOC125944160 [Dermacentor silvarum]